VQLIRDPARIEILWPGRRAWLEFRVLSALGLHGLATSFFGLFVFGH
jgi:hypothetical protein